MLRQVPLMRSRLVGSMTGSPSGTAATASSRMPVFLGNRTFATGATIGQGRVVGGPTSRMTTTIMMPQQHHHQQQQAMTTDASILAARGTMVWSNHSSGLVQSIHQTAQDVRTSLSDVFRNAVWQMSSTLKKRRAKMNKHKLRKRRKLERRKSK